MAYTERSANYLKFIIYLVVVILINIAGYTLFFRIDLTSNRVYSLSDASKKVVSNLSEPLTVNVFFTKNLPAPYNGVEKYLRDLLEEYAVYANSYFNYRFYSMSSEEGAVEEEVENNQELARGFGIYPSQIQVLEKDQVSFKSAYMGLAIVHGDIIEKIPEITSSEQLEYTLTTAIQRMNNKVSALLGLSENIRLKLFLSSSIMDIAPLMGIEGLTELEENLKDIVKDLNSRSYGKLEFSSFDPLTDSLTEEELKKYSPLSLEWPDAPEHSIRAGKGYIGFTAQYRDRLLSIPLIRQMRIPLLGTQYELIDKELLSDVIYDSMESLIEINENIGYLSDHGCIDLWGRNMGMPAQASVSNFNDIASRTYSLKEIRLTDDDLLDNLDCLIIAGPKEPFTDHELFRLDQFLMKGKSLALFLDPFQESEESQGAPSMVPVDTGLEKLLEHYGLATENSLVMDENCYIGERPVEYGGGELPYYYVIRITDEFINRDPGFMKNIRALYFPTASPVFPIEARISENGLNATPLLASSGKSWKQENLFNMNPMFMQPPGPETERESYPLAYLLEGEFSSYFEGKPVPEYSKETNDESLTNDENTGDMEKPEIDSSNIKSEGMVISKGNPGRIFLAGSSEILQNSLIDSQGSYPNAVFVMNVIDYLNGREETAVMRAKSGTLNPLDETTSSFRAFIKYFNMTGLPALVIIFGLAVWFYRTRRKKRIQDMFR